MACHQKLWQSHEAGRRPLPHRRGPYLLDIQTYRYKGHSMSDPQKYRTKDEVLNSSSVTPFEHCAKVLQDNKWMTEAQLKEVDKESKPLWRRPSNLPKRVHFPEKHELYEDVYVTPDYPFVKD